MTTRQADMELLLRRVREAGWRVVPARRGNQSKIYAPDGSGVTIHATYSDRNALEAVERELNALGFDKAEAAAKRKRERERRAKLTEDAEANAKAIALAERRQRLTAKAAGPYAMDDVDEGWFLQPHPAMVTKRVWLTPALAEKLATLIRHNRKPKRRSYDRLVRALNNGIHVQGDPPDDRWVMTHQGIAIDSNMVLQDGQNRIRAIVDTGVTAPIQISVGCDPAAWPAIDVGAPRTQADAVHAAGMADSGSLSSAARTAWLMYNVPWQGSLWTNYDVGHEIVLAMLEADRERFEWAAHVARQMAYRKDLRAGRQTLTAALYLIDAANDGQRERLEEFLEAFATNVFNGRSDPRNQLQRTIANHREAKGRRPAYESLALVLKTWRWWNEGAEVTPAAMRWRTSEDMPPVYVHE